MAVSPTVVFKVGDRVVRNFAYPAVVGPPVSDDVGTVVRLHTDSTVIVQWDSAGGARHCYRVHELKFAPMETTHIPDCRPGWWL